MAKKKKEIKLTSVQILHLLTSTVKNMIDFKFDEARDGLRFLIMLDCVFPEECIPIDQEPDGTDECFNIMVAHAVAELSPFFKTSMRIKGPDGTPYRSFDTIPINKSNLAEFVSCLAEIDSFWAEMDQQVTEMEEVKGKTEGKNVVEGNNTVN